MKGASLRSAINEACKQCVVDPCSPGTWRQQVTLCSAFSCPLWHSRPKTASAIPESVLRWYGAAKGDYQSFNEAFE
jgi:hypothetical protein